MLEITLPSKKTIDLLFFLGLIANLECQLLITQDSGVGGGDDRPSSRLIMT